VTVSRALDPIDRLSEVLFGLIMVLTFTGSLSVYEAGREDVRTMLAGALGCNLAWGLIDAVFYLMGCLAEKGRDLATFRALRAAPDPGTAHGLLKDALPPMVASVMSPTEIESLRTRVLGLPQPPARAGLDSADLRGAVAVFLWVVLTTFPVVIPFIVMRHPVAALRVSNAIAVALLFTAGYLFGRLTGRSPALVGAAMVVLGALLVGITMALGG
jgi:hypothetical protein